MLSCNNIPHGMIYLHVSIPQHVSSLELSFYLKSLHHYLPIQFTHERNTFVVYNDFLLFPNEIVQRSKAFSIKSKCATKSGESSSCSLALHISGFAPEMGPVLPAKRGNRFHRHLCGITVIILEVLCTSTRVTVS